MRSRSTEVWSRTSVFTNYSRNSKIHVAVQHFSHSVFGHTLLLQLFPWLDAGTAASSIECDLHSKIDLTNRTWTIEKNIRIQSVTTLVQSQREGISQMGLKHASDRL